MSFLKRFFGGGSEDTTGAADDGSVGADDAEWRVAAEASFDAAADRQRVTVWLRVHDAAFENEREQQRVFGLENRMMRALDESGVGEHDTNTLEPGYFAMRLIGDDADAIVAVIVPLLDEAPAGSYLAVRRGPSGTGEDRLEVGSGAAAAGPPPAEGEREADDAPA